MFGVITSFGRKMFFAKSHNSIALEVKSTIASQLIRCRERPLSGTCQDAFTCSKLGFQVTRSDIVDVENISSVDLHVIAPSRNGFFGETRFSAR